MNQEIASNYFKDKIDALDRELTEHYEMYIKFHDDLTPFRGKPADDKVEEINAILKNIQYKFSELYPILAFIAQRYEFANNVTNEYIKFIDELKKALGNNEQSAVS